MKTANQFYTHRPHTQSLKQRANAVHFGLTDSDENIPSGSGEQHNKADPGLIEHLLSLLLKASPETLKKGSIRLIEILNSKRK